MSKTKVPQSLSAISSIVLLLLFFSACHFRKKIEHKAIVNQPIQALTLKIVDSSYAKTFIQPKPLKYAKFLSKADHYHQAFDDLKAMLEGQKEEDFERAVFISEIPYYGGSYTYSAFQNSISAKQMFIEKLIEANDQSDTIDFNVHVNEYGRFKLADIRYLPHQKKELYRKALSNWAIFKYITDTVFIHTLKDSAFYTLYHAPYSYATADPFGIKNWSNSQVINLLISDDNKGNCFALTALYKILSDRLNADAKLCTAPQHIYIQHQDPKGQYYNVELATAGHPGDGIIQTLTYTPSEAIMSGIALRDYDTKQSIGLCLINLAKSYEHTFNTKDDEFLLRCAELALKHDSLNLNALLLKAQVLDVRVSQYATQHHLNSIAKLKQEKGIMPLVNKLEKHLYLLYQLGYREMPYEMQQQIMNPFGYDTKKWNHVSQNARPFTSFEPKDPKDAEYWTLTKGMFKEVWEPTAQETYGHYTLTTATGKLKSIDTSNHKGQLIDPVAFAYDFGARMYDARIGRFLSTDPHEKNYPGFSPYQFCNDNPIFFKDNDGRDGIATTTKATGDGAGTLKNPNVIEITATYYYQVGEMHDADIPAALNAACVAWNNTSYTVQREDGQFYQVKFNLKTAIGDKSNVGNHVRTVGDAAITDGNYVDENTLESSSGDLGANSGFHISLNTNETKKYTNPEEGKGVNKLSLLTEVLKHEIGHNLGLIHSKNGLMTPSVKIISGSATPVSNGNGTIDYSPKLSEQPVSLEAIKSLISRLQKPVNARPDDQSSKVTELPSN